MSNDCGRIKLIILKVREKSGDSLLIFVIYYYLLPFEFRRWKKSVFFPWLGFFFPNFKCISKKWRKTSIYAFFFKTVTSGQVYHPSITAICTLRVQRWSLFVRIWQEIILVLTAWYCRWVRVSTECIPYEWWEGKQFWNILQPFELFEKCYKLLNIKSQNNRISFFYGKPSTTQIWTCFFQKLKEEYWLICDSQCQNSTSIIKTCNSVQQLVSFVLVLLPH